MVFYRKYRPQTIDELDSAAVREVLTKVLARDVPHAFLFTGPKGLGKTSTARIVAKSVNCTGKNRSGIEPCNTCEECVSITKGTNLDILEIDGASNRGIDEIRELKEKIRLSPLSARKKVYIIDEVHMLTTEAFNALLKTLEEPPSHALFILCTTEPQKIPPTILSRCFHIAFKPATDAELLRSFKRIIKAEKIMINDKALVLIATLSEGGFRDGVKILEELVSLSGGEEITEETIEKRFRVSSTDNGVTTFLKLLKTCDTKEAISLLTTLAAEGNDLKYFLETFLEAIHSLLLQDVGVKEKLSDKDPLFGFTLSEIKILYYLGIRAAREMRDSVVPELPLELLVLDWAAVSSDASPTGGSGGTPKDETVSIPSLRKEVGNIAKIKALYGTKDDEHVKKQEDRMPDARLLDFSKDGEITPEWLAAFWKGIISEMRSHNHTIAGVLRGCMIKNYDRKQLTIEAGYSFHKEKLEEPKTKQALEIVCKSLTGKPIAVAIVLKV